MQMGFLSPEGTTQSGAYISQFTTSMMQLLNLLPIPGLGLLIGFAIKFIFKRKKDTIGPVLMDQIIKRMLAAIDVKDYALAASLAYGSDYSGSVTSGYTNFWQSYARWPNIPPLFFTAMLGDAITTNKWQNLFAFLAHIDPYTMDFNYGRFIYDAETAARVAYDCVTPEHALIDEGNTDYIRPRNMESTECFGVYDSNSDQPKLRDVFGAWIRTAAANMDFKLPKGNISAVKLAREFQKQFRVKLEAMEKAARIAARNQPENFNASETTSKSALPWVALGALLLLI